MTTEAAAPAMEPGPSVSPGPSSSFKEELLCAVCYDPFRDAVTLRCGHNFCRRCVSGCWEVQTTPSCPVCKERAAPGDLRTNHTLNNLVETLLREEAEGARWTGRRSPRPCRTHRAPLTLFCLEDKELLCCACQADARHQEHRVQPIKDTAQDFRVSNAPPTLGDPGTASSPSPRPSHLRIRLPGPSEQCCSALPSDFRACHVHFRRRSGPSSDSEALRFPQSSVPAPLGFRAIGQACGAGLLHFSDYSFSIKFQEFQWL